MNTRVLLSTHELAVTRGGKQLLRGLTLSCRAGERWAVLGLNGAGKSSLLDVLSGLLMPAQGEVRYGESTRDATALLDAVQLAALRSHVSQRYTPRFAMRVSAFVAQGAEDEKRATQWMKALNVASLADRDITQLSGGELQRVTLARHLVRERDVALLDEPLTHLDPAHQQQLLQILRSESYAQRCIIAAVHDVNWAQAFATHVLLLGCEGSRTSPQAGWIAGSAQEVMEAARLSMALGVSFMKIETEFGARWVS
jgi:iron complex transport system ATP-binding protein